MFDEEKFSFTFTDFEYYVTQKPQPRICFGSAQERIALPLKGPCLSPFMRRMALETRENVGPSTYENKRDAFSDVTNRVRYKTLMFFKFFLYLSKHIYD